MSFNFELPLSVTEIQQILPHRYPFLMLDKIVEFVDRERIVGKKNVTINEEYFQGHFPGRPIMPGVLIIEALAQLGVVFAKLSTGGVPKEKLMVFSGVESLRFRRPVSPGDVLTLECSNFKNKFGHWKMNGKAMVEGEVVCEAILMAAEI